MSQRVAAEAHQGRPSPDEPWRYACPHCGSVCVTENRKNGHPQSQRVVTVDGNSYHYVTVDAPRYRCDHCGDPITEDELVDRKERGE